MFMPTDVIGGLNDFGMSLIQGTTNAWMEGRRNKYNQQVAQYWYDRQRKDALADWQMQADYNSPAKQMERLKAAGLNPNLVYGNGADAQMGAAPRGSNTGYPPSAGGPVQRSDVGISLDQYFNYQARQVQIDNMRVQGDLLKQEKLQRAIGLGGAEEMLDYNLQVRQAQAWKLRNEAELLALRHEVTTEELDIIRQTKVHTVDRALETVLNLRANRAKTDEERERIKHAGHVLMQSEELAEFEIQMRKDGIMPGTPQWLRAFQLFFRNLVGYHD